MLRFSLKVVVSILLLLLLLRVLIQFTFVQNFLVQKITTLLSNQLQTKISIEKVDLEFFKTLVLENVLVEDQQQDTILAAHKIGVDIQMFSLFKKELSIKEVYLKDVVSKLYTKPNTDSLNIQFMLDAFQPKKKESGSSPTPWNFDLKKVNLENINFSYDEAGVISIKTIIPILNLYSKELDFNRQFIDLDELVLQNAEIQITEFPSDPTSPGETTHSNGFPVTGWQILANEIRLDNNQLTFSRSGSPIQQLGMDFNHLGFDLTNIHLNNLVLNDTLIAGKILKAKLTERSGFQLKGLSGNIELSPKSISAKAVSIETNQSKIFCSTNLDFDRFEDLSAFLKKVKVNSEFKNSIISMQDIKMIAGNNWPEFLSSDLILKLNGNISLNDNAFFSKGFRLSLPNNQMLQLRGSLTDISGAGIFDLKIQKLTSSFNGLSSLFPGIHLPEYLSQLGQIEIQTSIKGSYNDLETKNLEVNTESANCLFANIQAKNIIDFRKAHFNLDIKKLALESGLIHSIAGSPSTAIFDSLGIVLFTGKASGTQTQIQLTGDIQSSPGKINSDLNINFSDDYENANYKVAFKFMDLDIGKMVNIDPLVTSGIFKIEGKGFQLDNVDLSWESDLSSFMAIGYDYHGLNFSGEWKGKEMKISGKVNDEHFKTSFDAAAFLDEHKPELTLTSNIDTLNFHRLNLSKNPLSWSGILDVDFFGNSIDELEGSLSAKNWVLSNNSMAVQSDLLTISSKQLSGEEKQILLVSDFVSANIQGNYRLTSLPDLGIQFFSSFFPVPSSFEKMKQDTLSEVLKDMKLTFDIETGDCSDLLKVLDTTWVSWEPAILSGNFNSQTRQLKINGLLSRFAWKTYDVDSLTLDIETRHDSLTSKIAINEIRTDDIIIPPAQLKMAFANKNLDFQLDLDKAQSKKLALGGTIESKPELFELNFNNLLIINDSLWAVDPQNKFEIYDHTFSILDFGLEKGIQKLTLQTLAAKGPMMQGPLQIQIADFSMDLLSKVIDFSGNAPRGLINGNIKITDPLNTPVFDGEMKISDLRISDKAIGNLVLKANQKPKIQAFEFFVDLAGAGNELSVSGDYGLKAGLINAKIDVGQLNADLAEIVAGETIEETSGTINGVLQLSGKPSQPSLTGRLLAKNIKTLLKVSNARYHIMESQIDFKENRIDLGRIVVNDEAEKKLEIRGAINHQYFQDFKLDLRFESDEIQVLNTNYEAAAIYYGTLLVKTSGTVAGPIDRIQLKVDATTLPGSALTVLPSTQDDLLLSNQIIVFGHPDSIATSGEINTKAEIANPYNFDINASLQITPDAQLTIELDPESGDGVVCNGNANLVVDMDAVGNLEVIGDYIFEKGKYNFNYEGLIKKEFEIQKGSALNFPGDPYKARFALDAIYRSKTSTIALIESQSTLSDDELREAKKSTEVLILLHISGDMESPELSFEIQIPKMEEGRIGSAVSRRLSQLNENPDELNKQVFGLLFFNSFIAFEQGIAGESFANSLESAAFSSLRGFMTNQLNTLANKYVKGFEVEFAMDTYNSGAIDGSVGVVSEFGVSLSKKLFNDRLTMQVGSNFNMTRDDVTSWSNSDFTSLAGDFILEYKLTEAGNYLLRVFHLNDYDILEGENNYETGVSIMLRKKLKRKIKK